ncbi:MAG: outer membrane lipid asymmetry maintenance protein MlaD [Proteobacteria bacterium]|nr:outer membrane lipid asymmetry maintenance protein MlaD [Pseudomonadota bacterium]
MHQARAIDLGVGLFILLGIGSVLFLLMQTMGLTGFIPGNTYRLQARFDHVGDLKIRAPVAMAGVTIGRVAKITVDPIDFRALVEMQISLKYDYLAIDSDASIASSGLLGGKYVELQPGGDLEVLKDQDEIEFTQSAILLENLIGKYMLGGAKE